MLSTGMEETASSLNDFTYFSAQASLHTAIQELAVACEGAEMALNGSLCATHVIN